MHAMYVCMCMNTRLQLVTILGVLGLKQPGRRGEVLDTVFYSVRGSQTREVSQ